MGIEAYIGVSYTCDFQMERDCHCGFRCPGWCVGGYAGHNRLVCHYVVALSWVDEKVS